MSWDSSLNTLNLLKYFKQFFVRDIFNWLYSKHFNQYLLLEWRIPLKLIQKIVSQQNGGDQKKTESMKFHTFYGWPANFIKFTLKFPFFSLYLLESMLQMASVALETILHTSCEIDNHSITILGVDFFHFSYVWNL